MSQTDNKRVAKNAVALTLRMILVTIVGLYTSRIVLEALGVEDYGIYGVIGGVVGMASFLNSSMAGATSRFITFELGHGDESKLKKIFSTSLIIHIAIALIVFVLAETIGLWFVNNKMNFPDGSMSSVNILYQFTIISMMVNFTQVPYSAAIIAHEKMSIYAYFEIINVVLKIAIATMLLFVSSNKLILYAGLMMAVSIVSALIYRIYCIRHFKETKFKFVIDRTLIRGMLSFSGFDLYGNMCTTFKFQSQPIVLNMFFGVVANVGASIALTITGAISGLTTSITQAFNPQIIKQYSNGNLDNMASVMRRSVQFTMLAYGIIALPVFIYTDLILDLWLGQVPAYSVEFIRLIIITAFFSIVVTVSNTAIHATGDIKLISFYTGTLHLLAPIISYVVIKFIFKDASLVYIVNILLMVIIIATTFRFIHIQIPNLNIHKYLQTIAMSFVLIITAYTITYFANQIATDVLPATEPWSRFVSATVVSVTGVSILFGTTFKFALTCEERQYLLMIIKNKLNSFKLFKH